MATAVKDERGFIVGFKGKFSIFKNSTMAALQAGVHNRELRERLAEEGVNVEFRKGSNGTITVLEVVAESSGDDGENEKN